MCWVQSFPSALKKVALIENTYVTWKNEAFKLNCSMFDLIFHTKIKKIEKFGAS